MRRRQLAAPKSELELDRLVADGNVAGLDQLIVRLNARLTEHRELADSTVHLSYLLETLLTRHMMMTVDQARFRESIAAAVAVPVHWTPAERAMFLLRMGRDVAGDGIQLAASEEMDKADRLLVAAHEVFMVALTLADEDDSRTRADLYFNDLQLFLQRYQHSRDPGDLQRVVVAGHAVLESAEAGPRVRASALFNLSWAFATIGENDRDPESLDAGIVSMIILLAEFPLAREIWRQALAILKGALEVRVVYPPPLDAAWPGAASRLVQVVELASDPEPELGEIAALAGVLMTVHASVTEDRDAIQDALRLLAWARGALPARSELSAEVARNTGMALLFRFKSGGDVADLEESVQTLRGWLRTADELGLDGAEHADDLALALAELGHHTSQVAPLDEAVRLHSVVLDELAPDDPTRFLALNNLTLASWYRFELTGRIEDLDSAIRAGDEAARLASASPAGLGVSASVLLNLGSMLRARFDATGKLADLDRGIGMLRSSVEASPPGDPGLPMRLSNLGHALFARFRRYQALADIGAAIEVTGQAIALTPPEHPDFARFQANLCADLLERYQAAGDPDPADLVAARNAGAAAVGATPDGHPRRGLYLRNLIGVDLLAHSRGEPADLDEAMHLARLAVSISDCSDIDRADNLGALSNMHTVRGELPEATEAARSALEFFPVGHLGRAAAARHLGGLLLHDSPADAITLLCEVSRIPTAPITIRLSAAADWVRALEATGAAAGARYSAYREAAQLLPLLAWHGSSRADHERLLAEQSGLASAAAAAAIDADDPAAAVEVLEHSRSVLWGRMLDLRTDLADLRAADPDLADRLDAVRAALDVPSPAGLDDADNADESFVMLGQSQWIQAGDDSAWREIPAEQIRIPPTIAGLIPRDPPAFQRRAGLMAALRSAGAGTSVIRAADGMCGVGKTQLAAAYARECMENGWRLIAWLDARSLSEGLDHLASVTDFIGMKPRNADTKDVGQIARVRLEADGDGCLVVFDNVTDVSALRSYLPGTGKCQVVLVAADDNSAEIPGRPIWVGTFTEAESVAFLVGRTGRDDPEGARELSRELGHLPMALTLAATIIADQRLSYRAYLDQLGSFPIAGHLASADGEPYPRGLAEVILLSIDAVTGADPTGLCGALLEMMAMLSPDGINPSMLHAAGQWGTLTSEEAPVGPQAVDRALGLLAKAALLTHGDDDPPSAVVHRAIMRVVRERCAHAGSLIAAGSRICEFLTALSGSMDEPWRQQRLIRDYFHQVTAFCGHLAFHHADEDASLAEDVLALRVRALVVLNETRDSPAQATQYGELLVADCVRLLGEDHPETVRARKALAYAYQAARNLEMAIPLFEQTLTDSERVLGADAAETLNAGNELAAAYNKAGRTDEAISLYERALADCARVLGVDAPETLTIRANLGEAYEKAGRVVEAIAELERTLAARVQALGQHHPHTLMTRNNLASAYGRAGRVTEAISLFESTLSELEGVLGPQHPDTQLVRANLAAARHAARGPRRKHKRRRA